MKKQYPWMTEDQEECYEFLCDLYLGEHHLSGKLHEWGSGIKLNTYQVHRFATFDFNRLTRAVVMAHDRCIRFCIEPSGPKMLALSCWKRHKREGQIHERHPTQVSRRMIAVGMGVDTATVSGLVAPLVRDGLLDEVGKGKCSVTGNNVMMIESPVKQMRLI